MHTDVANGEAEERPHQKCERPAKRDFLPVVERGKVQHTSQHDDQYDDLAELLFEIRIGAFANRLGNLLHLYCAGVRRHYLFHQQQCIA